MLRSVRLSPGVSARQAPQEKHGSRQPGHAGDGYCGAPVKHSREHPRTTARAQLTARERCAKQQVVGLVAGAAAAANLRHAPYAAAEEALAAAEGLTTAPEAVEQLTLVEPALADAVAPPAGDAVDSLLDSASAGALDASAAVQDAASAAAEAVANVTEETAASLAAAASAVTSAASDATSAVTSVASGATSAVLTAASDVTAAASGATSAVSTAASEATAAVTGTLAKAVGTASGALDAIGGSVGQATASITATAGGAVAAVTSAVDSGVAAVNDATSSVQNAVASSVAATSAATSAAFAGAFAQLPPEAQAALLTVPRGLAAAADFVVAYPVPVAVGAVAVAVPLTAQYLKERYGGFAGELEPYEAYDVLLNEDAVLVDIRSQAERETSGLPELKYASRFKATVWEPLALDPALLKRMANGKTLELEVNAAYLSGIKLVRSPLTKFIILDSAGSDTARDLARALRAVGVASPYIVSGGFRAWVESGLGVNEGGALVYDGNVVDYLADELELLGQQVVDASRPLQDPVVATSVGAGLIATAVAIYNYRTTLEWIGVLGLMASAANFALKYDSPEAMAADFKQSWGKLAGAFKSSAPKRSAAPTAQPAVPSPAPTSKPAAYSNGTAAAAPKEAKQGDVVPAVQEAAALASKDVDTAPGPSSPTDA